MKPWGHWGFLYPVLTGGLFETSASHYLPDLSSPTPSQPVHFTFFFFSLFSHLLLFHSKDSLSFEVMLEQCALTKNNKTQLSAMVLQKMERRGKSQNSFKIDPDICITWLPSVSKDWCDWVYSKLYVSVKHISMSNFTLHFCFGRSLVVVYLLYSINL